MSLEKPVIIEESSNIRNSWYDKIEPPIRDVVKLLRENGFNTESSCGHDMYVQCQYAPDGEIQRLHYLLSSAGFKNYNIIVTHQVIGGNFLFIT